MPAARRRSMAEFLQQQRQLEEPAASQAGALDQVPAAVPAVIAAGSIPEPHSPAGDGQLSPAEEADLATCEAALDNLRLAFAAAGKALQVIRDAGLYRGAHGTFEAYVEQRWDMSRAQAYRLIEAWPLAERLSPIGDKIINESQVRELLPLASRHGQDAAAAVYQAVAEADGVRVTAAVLRGVVGILPADHFDPAEAVSQIRAYLASDHAPPQPPPADPVRAFTSESSRFVKNLHRFATSEAIKAARAADPGAVRQAVAALRAALDEIERGIT
jgi:hypothetical protein